MIAHSGGMKIPIAAILCCVSLLQLAPGIDLFAADGEAESDASSSTITIEKLLSEEPYPEGEVTIPYAEMKRLWQALREKGKPPEKEKSPIAAVVASAEYELELSEARSQLRADYIVEVLSDEWQLIPLIGGAISLEKSEVSQGHIVRRDGFYTLIVKGKGEYQVHLLFRAVGLDSWPSHPGLKLHPTAASLSRLMVRGLPDDQWLRLQGLDKDELMSSAAENNGQDYFLSGEGEELSLRLESAAVAKESAAMANAPVIASVWDIQSQIFVRYAEGRLFYEARVFAQSDAGSALSMELEMPHKVAAVVVDGEDIASWRMGRSQDGRRKLHIDWRTRDRLDRRFQLSYQMAQSPLSDEWVIVPPGGEREGEETRAKHLLAIEVVEGLEWKGEGLSSTVASRRLPKWLGEHVKEVEFVTAETSGPLQIEAEWLPVLETVRATVSLAKFNTRLVKDGAMLVEAEYHVQQSESFDWTVNIPSLEQVLNCEVNGKAVKPIRRNESELEFHLTAASGGGGDGVATVIRFSYALQSSAFDLVSGQVTVELPQTDLFIHRLEWDLEIPEIYETTAVEGNVQLAQSRPSKAKKAAPVKRHLIRLQKELCRGERPAVEVYYRRRGIDD